MRRASFKRCEYRPVLCRAADIVGYTSMSSGLPPRVVLRMLHTYFARLDATLDMTGAFKYQVKGR